MQDNNDIQEFEFTAKKIKWYPDDLEKMEGMTIEERIAYKRLLKQNHKYTYEN